MSRLNLIMNEAPVLVHQTYQPHPMILVFLTVALAVLKASYKALKSKFMISEMKSL